MRRAAAYCDGMMTTRLIQTAAWAILAAIIFMTVSPIGLRPHTISTVNTDRALAYMLSAAVFVLAYPRHWKTVAILLIIGAMGIELLQYLSPTRHAHLSDAMVKAAGAACGVVLGWTINLALASRLRR